MPFRNTKLDYIIFLAASVTLMYSIFTLDVVYYGDTNISELYRHDTDYYYLDLNVQLVIAPIVLLHRMFMLLAGEYRVKRLKERNIKIKLRVFRIKLFERIHSDVGSLSINQKILAACLWLFSIFLIIFVVGVLFG